VIGQSSQYRPASRHPPARKLLPRRSELVDCDRPTTASEPICGAAVRTARKSLVHRTTTSGHSARGGVLHRPGGPQVNALDADAASAAVPLREAKQPPPPGWGTWLLRSWHGRALSKWTAAAAHRSDSRQTQPRATAAAQIQACVAWPRRDCFCFRAGSDRATATPRTHPSCRGRADDCMARMMRKSNHARSPLDAALLLL
jgi:hypothetical protein